MDEIDIWRTAKLMIERHGLHAEANAGARAAELHAHGDIDGCAVWHRVFAAIEELRRVELRSDEHRH